MPPTGFEPAIPARELPQTYALGCAATETSTLNIYRFINILATGQIMTDKQAETRNLKKKL
jgi:hypothetical protein